MKREPDVRAPRSMSIIGPARSRWSRGSKANSGFARLDIACTVASSSSMPSAALSCGMFGSVEHRRLEGGVGLAQRALERRQAVAQLGRGGDLGGGVAPGALGLADRLGGGVALGPQLVDLRLQRAPALVEREHLVEQAVGLAARERRAHALGVGADDPDVEHALSLDGSTFERASASASSSCATPSSCTDGITASASPMQALVGVRHREPAAGPLEHLAVVLGVADGDGLRGA